MLVLYRILEYTPRGANEAWCILSITEIMEELLSVVRAGSEHTPKPDAEAWCILSIEEVLEELLLVVFAESEDTPRFSEVWSCTCLSAAINSKRITQTSVLLLPLKYCLTNSATDEHIPPSAIKSASGMAESRSL